MLYDKWNMTATAKSRLYWVATLSWPQIEFPLLLFQFRKIIPFELFSIESLDLDSTSEKSRCKNKRSFFSQLWPIKMSSHLMCCRRFKEQAFPDCKIHCTHLSGFVLLSVLPTVGSNLPLTSEQVITRRGHTSTIRFSLMSGNRLCHQPQPAVALIDH